MTSSNRDWTRVVAMLLEKAERESSEAERDEYLRKANELMLKYALDQDRIAKLRKANKRIKSEGLDEDEEKGFSLRFCEERSSPLIKAKRELVGGLAGLNRCFGVLAHRRAYVQVFGSEADVRFVSMMYASILTQLQTAMASAEKELAEMTPGWRVSYAHGYVRRVIARMNVSQKEMIRKEESAAPGSALVLVGRSDLAKKYAMQEFNTSKFKSATIPTGAGKNLAGYSRGDRDGRNADIGNDRLASGTRNKALGS